MRFSILLFGLLLFLGCSKEETPPSNLPTADFEVFNSVVRPFEIVRTQNNSMNGIGFQWTADGQNQLKISNSIVFQPNYQFESTGIYDITLRVTGANETEATTTESVKVGNIKFTGVALTELRESALRVDDVSQADYPDLYIQIVRDSTILFTSTTIENVRPVDLPVSWSIPESILFDYPFLQETVVEVWDQDENGARDFIASTLQSGGSLPVETNTSRFFTDLSGSLEKADGAARLLIDYQVIE